MPQPPPPLRPYILGSYTICRRLHDRLAAFEPLRHDPLSRESLAFFRLLNAANALAYGDLGMPAWVQLDCCTTPTAMIGFATPRERFPEEAWEALLTLAERRFGGHALAELERYDGWVPVSEYCALPAVEPGVVTGVSMFALLPGQRLGLRSKALSLFAHAAQAQVGMTQYANRAVRTHCLLGELRILAPAAWPHTKAHDTFVYRVEVPDDERLIAMAQGEVPASPEGVPPHDFQVDIGDHPQRRVLELDATHGPLAIVAPGHLEHDGHVVLALRRVEP